MNDEPTDEPLDQLVTRARTNYRVPPATPPFEEMWTAIEREIRPQVSHGPDRRARPWWGVVAGIAAALVIGFALGRTSLPGPAAGPGVAAGLLAPRAVDDARVPYEQTATVLLGETAVLLTALPVASSDSVSGRRFVTQAAELLVTTRLLLDSQTSPNPRLHELLEDLELVLAQIARIDGKKSETDLELITEALHERDIVPRIRSVAAGLAATDD